MEIQRIECPADGRRLDVLLAEKSGLTRSRVAALMDEGNVTVDGQAETKAGAKPKPGQVVCLTVPAPKPAIPEAQDIPLTILYQDDDLAVVVKPCGMVVHPAAGNEDGTLVNALLHHLDSLGGIGGELRPGIVHRLDKDTSGLLLVAKNDQAQLALSRQLQERLMEKHYRALVEGNIREEAGRVEAAIARSKKDRKKMAVDPEGREAVTEWQVLERGRGVTLLDVHILTGRTHQIRVHMKHIGHPVCGDPIYGSGRGAKVSRLMLHAYSLAFTHPATGERMTFTAPLPEAFLASAKGNGIDLNEGGSTL
ncbi:MAG: RluA family pseudouridine synthase [Christensenellaceae bacterium]|nr:RluA family pseudouridine synthase [Christensenellaceae bacterium]